MGVAWQPEVLNRACMPPRQLVPVPRPHPATRPAQPAPELRERDFGALDGGSDASYLAEWSRDAEDTDYKAGGTGAGALATSEEGGRLCGPAAALAPCAAASRLAAADRHRPHALGPLSHHLRHRGVGGGGGTPRHLAAAAPGGRAQRAQRDPGRARRLHLHPGGGRAGAGPGAPQAIRAGELRRAVLGAWRRGA